MAEILNSLVFLFNDLGIDFGWRIIHGTPDFYSITKKTHNLLQGQSGRLKSAEKKLYLKTNQDFSKYTHLDHDLVIIHDPQPLAMINYYTKNQPWILRFHLDLSCPNKNIWQFLKPMIKKYDQVVVSNSKFIYQCFSHPEIIFPAIDPLTNKNKKLSRTQIRKYLAFLDLDPSLPIISQISRFDKWKDPEGAIKVFDRVKRRIKCQLVLLGNVAMDDPEAVFVYDRISKKYRGRKDIKICVNIENNDLVVNALQRASDVVIQKSLKEGFGLTVAEALYKETPVVASNIGGIPLQLIDSQTGFLHQPKNYSAFSQSIV